MTDPSPYRVRRGQAVGRAGQQPTFSDLSALPGVPEAVEAARAALTALRGHPALRRGRERVAAAAAVRAARASAALDGAPLALDRGDNPGAGGTVTRAMSGGDAEVGPPAGGVTQVRSVTAVMDPRLAGALRVAASLPELTAVWRRTPLQALARLHVLAAADLVGPDRLGRPRPDPGIGPRLTALADAVTAAPWPAPVMVAVVHGELLALQAFGCADGVVARAAARLAMMTSGLDPDGVGVPEVAFLRSGSRYPAMAREFDSAGGGFTAWILMVCEALIAGAREGGSIADAAE